MRSKILMSVLVIGVAVTVMGMGFSANFSDTETSSGNRFTAGVIDLEVDCDYLDGTNSWGPTEDPDMPHVFHFDSSNDIKPGHNGEATLSLHLKDGSNNADLWMKIINVVNNQGIQSEPEEEKEDDIGAVFNIADHIQIKLWNDEGSVEGWQNDGSDSKEGNNVYDDGCCEEYCFEGTLAEAQQQGKLCCIDDGTACTTYYIGFSWEFDDVGNEYQGDFCTFDIVFGADQVQ